MLNLNGESVNLGIGVKDNYTLQLEEVTPFTKLVLDILYDVYYTKLFVNTSNECNKEINTINPIDIDKIREEFEANSNKVDNSISSLDSVKAIKVYESIIENQKNLILSEYNIYDIIEIVINRLDDYIDLSECILLYNTFDYSDNKEENDKLIDSLNTLNNLLTHDSYMSIKSDDRLSVFKDALLSIFPLINKYVLTELELCDAIKPLGYVTDTNSNDKGNKYQIYYINIEYPPMPPYGYSVFTYPLIPYRVNTYFDLDKCEICMYKPENYLILSVEVSDFCCNTKYQVDTVKIVFNIYKYNIITAEDITYLQNMIDKSGIQSDVQITDIDVDEINNGSNIEIINNMKLEVDFKDYILFYTHRNIEEFMGYMIKLFNYR